MAVDTVHPDYTDMSTEWAKMRHVVEGNKAIQANAITYLPKLSEQTDQEYEAYHKRGVFFNATGRVKETMGGMVFRKAPVIEAESIKALTDNMDMAGTALTSFCETILGEQLEVSRCGVLVDFPNGETSGLTQVQAEQLGKRPYARIYKAEDIINWKTEVVNGVTVLSLVVLREVSYERAEKGDEFEVEKVTRYRVLDMLEGVYRQRVFVKADKGYSLQSEVVPKRSGQAWSEIPFVFFGRSDNSADVSRPVMLDLADVNLGHWRNTCDYEHGLHLTGLPTAVLTGVADSDGVFRIGSGTAWVLSSDKANASFLEFTGQGLGAMRTAIKDKEENMAALGARILAPEKKDAEAADTISQKRAGENSVLAALANATSAGVTKVLALMRDWQGVSGDVKVTLNTDYSVVRMSAQEITAMLQAVLMGKVSSKSFYEALVRGEVVVGQRTYEEEQVLIQEEGQTLGQAA